MPDPLNKRTASLPIRAGQAILEYLGSLPELAGVTLRRDDDPRERPFPVLVVKVSDLRQSWGGSNEFEGILNVCYISGRDADANGDGVSAQDADLVANQAAHHAAAAALANALEDQGGARSFVNFGNANRAVIDFHLYRLLEHQENGEFSGDGGTAWQSDFMRKIVCARVDYAA